MSQPFEVSVRSVEEVHSLPGIWTESELRRLLEMSEMDDIGQVDKSELLDITLMALQDLGNQKAGELVLELIFGDTLRPGQRQNLVDDLQQDEPWADHPVVAQQRGLFVAVVLLEKAFPNRYGAPEALRFGLDIRALSEAGVAALNSLAPARLMRLLAQGMSDTDVLNRLYEEDLASGPFADAAGMIWHLESAPDGQGRSCSMVLLGPRTWFGPLSKGQVFRADA